MELQTPHLLERGKVVNIEGDLHLGVGTSLIVKLANPTTDDSDRYKIVVPDGEHFCVYDLKDWEQSEKSSDKYEFDREQETYTKV